MDSKGNQQSSVIELVVVDCFNPCKCHIVVTARGKAELRWIFFSTVSTVDVNFGDTILYDETKDEIRLMRNPHLNFKITTTPLSEACASQLANESPPLVRPGDYPEIDYFPH